MKLITDLRQRHLEAFEHEVNTRKGDGDVRGLSTDAGLAVRSAIAAGWIIDATDPDVVGDMAPAAVRKLAKAVNTAYIEAVQTDPN
jgi:hypothetical protein